MSKEKEAPATYPNLSERESAVFNAVMDHYVQESEPVGSRRLAKDFKLSPATIRNIMADLEDYGLLKQPHISAGRIPSDEGYRFFVDNLLSMGLANILDPEVCRKVKESITVENEISKIMKQASDMLSKMTNYTGMVVTPKIINTIYKRIQFIRLSKRRILAIFVAKSGIVQNKVVITDQEYTQDSLDRISRLLNHRFEEMTLPMIREEMIQMLDEEKRQYDELLDSAAKMGELALRKDLFGKEEVFIEGAINIFEQPEFKDLGKLKDLFRTFTERTAMLRLLDKCLDTDGVVVAIGEETQIPEISDMSVVAAKYNLDQNVAGGLAVIGPKRMHYQYVVSLVQYTAKIMSLILQNIDNPNSSLDSINHE